MPVVPPPELLKSDDVEPNCESRVGRDEKEGLDEKGRERLRGRDGERGGDMEGSRERERRGV